MNVLSHRVFLRLLRSKQIHWLLLIFLILGECQAILLFPCCGPNCTWVLPPRSKQLWLIPFTSLRKFRFWMTLPYILFFVLAVILHLFCCSACFLARSPPQSCVPGLIPAAPLWRDICPLPVPVMDLPQLRMVRYTHLVDNWKTVSSENTLQC